MTGGLENPLVSSLEAEEMNRRREEEERRKREAWDSLGPMGYVA